jgi:hypothetical protein
MPITPAVIMMFRDEGDILEKSLHHWRSLGVDRFYLLDNGSADNSKSIAQRFVSTLTYVFDWDTATWEGRKLYNHLKIIALEDGANWLFPADADEFLQLPKGCTTVQEWLAQYPQNPAWGELPYLNIYPSGREVWQEPQRKAFGYFSADMTISVGNHIVENYTPTLDPFGAYYRHYSVRSYPQFRKKMINWMNAFKDSEFQDHPHVENYRRWQAAGDIFLQNLYNELNQPPQESAPKWL